MARSADGSFSTVVPAGFRLTSVHGFPVGTQYVVGQPGESVAIVAVRLPAAQTLSVLEPDAEPGLERDDPGSHGFSRVASTRVAGEPAFTFSFLDHNDQGQVEVSTRVQTQRGGLTYFLAAGCAPDELKAMDRVLSTILAGWRWRTLYR